MNRFKCESCGSFVDEKPCPVCQSSRVRPLRADEQPDAVDNMIASEAAKIAVPKAWDAETELEQPQPAQAAEESWFPKREQAPQPPQPSDIEKKIVGLDEFEALLAQGFRAVVVCGASKSGKSEITTGFTRANGVFRGRTQVSTTVGNSGVLYTIGGTTSGNVWFEIVNTRRKLVFLDPSGEFFHAISPSERKRLRLPDVTEEQLRFVRDAVKRLAGVVLVVDLTRTIDELADAPWRNQEIDLDYTLATLRWMRHSKDERTNGLGISAQIAASMQSFPRLDVPVLVLFSKGDRLKELTNANPLKFARARLPLLHASLLTHARRFRFDFAHTMLPKKGPDGKEHDYAVERPCGVLLSMEWLLTDPFRWMPSLPTRWLGGGK